MNKKLSGREHLGLLLYHNRNTVCVLKGTTGPSAETTWSPSSDLTSAEGELRLLPGEAEAV